MRQALLLLLLGASSIAAAATSYNVDPARSTLGFTATQTGGEFDGRFGKFHAQIVFADSDLAASRFDVEVDTASIDTQDDERDTALRGPDLFSVEKFPTAHFVSSGFTRKAPGQYEVVGKLTIRDVTREIRVPFTFQVAQEGGKPVAWLKGDTQLKRLDYGVGQGEWKDTTWVGDEVKVKFALRLIPAAGGDVRKPTTPPAGTRT